jgi:hypothetical protein
MQAHRDNMWANFPPFPSLAAIAKILEVNVALDDHGGAKRHVAVLHNSPQERRSPKRAEHLALSQVGSRPFHGIPARGFAQQRFR